MNITDHEKSSKKLSDKPSGSWEGLNKHSLSTNYLHQTLQIFEPMQLAHGSPQCSLTLRPKLVLISLKAIFVRLDRRWPEAEIISIWFPPWSSRQNVAACIFVAKKNFFGKLRNHEIDEFLWNRLDSCTKNKSPRIPGKRRNKILHHHNDHTHNTIKIAANFDDR